MSLPATPRRSFANAYLADSGFSLIELMVVVAVVSILATVALPSFLDSIRKGRRSEAVAAVAQVQQSQERWRANRTTYADNLKLTLAPPDGLGLASATAGGLYTLNIDTADANGYTLTATAISGTSQSHDTNCSTMRVRLAGGNIQYGGCGGCDVPEGLLSDPNRCWSR